LQVGKQRVDRHVAAVGGAAGARRAQQQATVAGRATGVHGRACRERQPAGRGDEFDSSALRALPGRARLQQPARQEAGVAAGRQGDAGVVGAQGQQAAGNADAALVGQQAQALCTQGLPR